MRLRDVLYSLLKGTAYLFHWAKPVKKPKTDAEIEKECLEALESDWINVGNDMRKAISKFEK